MTKTEFIIERTKIISEMLDNPDSYGIYGTTKCYARLDDLFDILSNTGEEPSVVQLLAKELGL